MMQDLAMHLIEIIMNSIAAGAKQIKILIFDSKCNDEIKLGVEDDGKGMSEELVQRVTNPFTTGRKTRSVGLGLSFMKGLCEACNGHLELESELGVGTKLLATVQKSHIDLPPLGNIGEMMMASIQANENIDFLFEYQTDTGQFIFDTKEVKQQLDGVSILEPEILLWIRDYINEGVKNVQEENV